MNLILFGVVYSLQIGSNQFVPVSCLRSDNYTGHMTEETQREEELEPFCSVRDQRETCLGISIVYIDQHQ